MSIYAHVLFSNLKFGRDNFIGQFTSSSNEVESLLTDEMKSEAYHSFLKNYSEKYPKIEVQNCFPFSKTDSLLSQNQAVNFDPESNKISVCKNFVKSNE